MKTWSGHLLSFYQNLKPPPDLPSGISWIFPQQSIQVMEVISIFLTKFYHDANCRTILTGINPGRHGAGITGVNFTAPRQLSENCFIPHPFGNGSEISAEFIYKMIEAYGGPSAFFGKYLIASVCPLGFVKDSRNLNYYDDPALFEKVEPFIRKSYHQLLQMPYRRTLGISIGGDKNYRHFSKLNQEEGWYDQIVSLPHPRFIMQYRRKKLEQYIDQYLEVLHNAEGK